MVARLTMARSATSPIVTSVNSRSRTRSSRASRSAARVQINRGSGLLTSSSYIARHLSSTLQLSKNEWEECAVLLDVWADLTCPWCFLGALRLDRARSTWQAEIEVVWRPFQLNPAARRPSERLVESSPAVLADNAGLLAEVGLPYRPTWRANT